MRGSGNRDGRRNDVDQRREKSILRIPTRLREPIVRSIRTSTGAILVVFFLSIASLTPGAVATDTSAVSPTLTISLDFANNTSQSEEADSDFSPLEQDRTLADAVLAAYGGVVALPGIRSIPLPNVSGSGSAPSNRTANDARLDSLLDGMDVTVESGPRWVTYNPSNGYLYVANYLADSVSVIDGATNTLVATIDVGDSPLRPVYNSHNGYIYVPNSLASHNLTVIDGISTVTVTQNGVQSGGIEVCADPYFPTFDPVNGYLYVPCLGGGVSVVSGPPETPTVRTIDVLSQPMHAVCACADGLVYVTNSGSGKVSVIDVGLNEIVRNIRVGSYPNWITYDRHHNFVYVMNRDSNNVSIINAHTMEKVGDYSVGAMPVNATYDSANFRVYVSNKNSNSVTVFNGTDKITPDITVGTAPFGGVYNPATKLVYVADSGPQSHEISAINTSTREVVSITVGVSPNSVTYDGGNGVLYVPNTGSSDVTLIPTSAIVNLKTQTVGSEPSFAAVNTWTGDVYIPNNGSNSVTVVSGTSDGVVQTVTLPSGGMNPCFATFDSIHGKVFVVDSGSGRVIPITGFTPGSVIDVGSAPRFAVFDPDNGYVYVVNSGSGDVTVIDGATNQKVGDPIFVGTPETKPWGAVYDPMHKLIFVAKSGVTGGVSHVAVIDTTTNQKLRDWSVGKTPLYPGYDPSHGYVYVPATRGWMVAVFDGNDKLGGYNATHKNPYSVAYNSLNDYVYIPTKSGGVSVFESTSGGTFLRAVVPAGSEPTWATFNPSTGLVTVTNSDGSDVTVINATLAVGTVNVTNNPTSAVYNGKSGKVYVTSSASDSVSVLGPKGPIVRVESVDVQANATDVTITWDTAPQLSNSTVLFGHADSQLVQRAQERSSSGNHTAFLNYLEPQAGYSFLLSTRAPGFVTSAIQGSWTTTAASGNWLNGTVYGPTNATHAPAGLLVSISCARFLPQAWWSTYTYTNAWGEYALWLFPDMGVRKCAQGGTGSTGYNVTVLNPEIGTTWTWPRHWNETVYIWDVQKVDFYLPLAYVGPLVPLVLDFSNAPPDYSRIAYSQTVTSTTTLTSSWSVGGGIILEGGTSGSSSSSSSKSYGSEIASNDGPLIWVGQYNTTGWLAYDAFTDNWTVFKKSMFELPITQGFASNYGSLFTPPENWLFPSSSAPKYVLKNLNGLLMDGVPVPPGQEISGLVTTSTTNETGSDYFVGIDLSATLKGVIPVHFNLQMSWSTSSSTTHTETLTWTAKPPSGGTYSCFTVYGQGGSPLGTVPTANMIGIWWWPATQNAQGGWECPPA